MIIQLESEVASSIITCFTVVFVFVCYCAYRVVCKFIDRETSRQRVEQYARIFKENNFIVSTLLDVVTNIESHVNGIIRYVLFNEGMQSVCKYAFQPIMNSTRKFLEAFMTKDTIDGLIGQISNLCAGLFGGQQETIPPTIMNSAFCRPQQICPITPLDMPPMLNRKYCPVSDLPDISCGNFANCPLPNCPYVRRADKVVCERPICPAEPTRVPSEFDRFLPKDWNGNPINCPNCPSWPGSVCGGVQVQGTSQNVCMDSKCNENSRPTEYYCCNCGCSPCECLSGNPRSSVCCGTDFSECFCEDCGCLKYECKCSNLSENSRCNDCNCSPCECLSYNSQIKCVRFNDNPLYCRAMSSNECRAMSSNETECPVIVCSATNGEKPNSIDIASLLESLGSMCKSESKTLSSSKQTSSPSLDLFSLVNSLAPKGVNAGNSANLIGSLATILNPKASTNDYLSGLLNMTTSVLNSTCNTSSPKSDTESTLNLFKTITDLIGEPKTQYASSPCERISTPPISTTYACERGNEPCLLVQSKSPYSENDGIRVYPSCTETCNSSPCVSACLESGELDILKLASIFDDCEGSGSVNFETLTQNEAYAEICKLSNELGLHSKSVFDKTGNVICNIDFSKFCPPNPSIARLLRLLHFVSTSYVPYCSPNDSESNSESNSDCETRCEVKCYPISCDTTSEVTPVQCEQTEQCQTESTESNESN
jgi:hypothetical protein